MAVTYEQIIDGKWYKANKNKIACCDCFLVHVVEVKKRNGKYYFKWTADRRATAQIRRHLKKYKLPKYAYSKKRRKPK